VVGALGDALNKHFIFITDTQKDTDTMFETRGIPFMLLDIACLILGKQHFVTVAYFLFY